LEVNEKKLRHVLSGGKEDDKVWKMLDAELKTNLDELEAAYEMVLTSNQPKVLPEEVSRDLEKLSSYSVTWRDGRSERLITEDQLVRLAIPKGSLSEEERKEIQSHVSHSFKFLSRIPWTRELRRVPEIAHAHHEKLDGSGYPLGIKSELIPLPSKIMTVADIFDALVARDRPYKKAIPVAKALDILGYEVKDGKLEPELVQLFIDTKTYELTLDH